MLKLKLDNIQKTIKAAKFLPPKKAYPLDFVKTSLFPYLDRQAGAKWPLFWHFQSACLPI